MDFNEKDYEKLSIIDKLVFKELIAKCKACKDGDKCQQNSYGMQPIIGKVEESYMIFYTPCKFKRGHYHSYIDIKSYKNIYKNSNRNHIIDELIKGNGGFIYGRAGHGKSYTMGYIANMLNKKGHDVYFDLANNIVQQVWKFETRDSKLKELQEVEYLFIDDFGGEKISSDIIYICWTPIIKSRIDNNKPTYFTSNYSLRELVVKLGKVSDMTTAQVLLDRIKVKGSYEFKDKDYRMGENV